MSRWYAVHSGLSAYVRRPRAAALYPAVCEERPALGAFRDPSQIAIELATSEGSAKNALVLELVMAWRRDRATRPLTGALLILGLWNDLSTVHQLLTGSWEESADETEGLLLYRFLHAVGSSDVSRAPDAGMSLVRSAARDTRRALQRTQDLDNRDLLIGGLMVATEPGVTVPFDQLSESDLRRALGSIVRNDDIDLLVEVFFNDRSRQWLSERFKRTPRQINVRVFRILRRLRRLAQ